jgi:hypothetical protein
MSWISQQNSQSWSVWDPLSSTHQLILLVRMALGELLQEPPLIHA